MHTGSIIDFYDDPNGLVLKTKMAAEQIPEFIKTAQYLEEPQRETLPDDVYALVMVDRGEKMRKYACVDKGNAALSVIYFLENKDKIPEEAQKVAAANLLTACSWYDLAPPAVLEKTAGLFNKAWGAMAMNDSVSGGAKRHKNLMSGKSMMPKVGDLTGSNIMPLSNDTEKTSSSGYPGETWEDKALLENTPTSILRVAQKSKRPSSLVDVSMSNARGVREALLKNPHTAEVTRNRLQKKASLSASERAFVAKANKRTAATPSDYVGHSNSLAGIKRQAKIVGLKGTKIKAWDGGPDKRVAVASDIHGAGWLAARPEAAASFGDKRPKYLLDRTRNRIFKQASLNPYVDVTGKSAPPRIEKVAHQRFALVKEGQGRFPIDTYGNVLEADRWFNDHGESLHPEERRELCTKLAARAEEIGCKVTDHVRKYAGAGYAPDGEVRVAVSTRMQYFQDDSPERDMLNGLMDKYAHVPPEVFCEAVRQFDEDNGLDYHWDTGVYDPWYTTYGFVKEAEWSFSTHGDRINEEQLKQVVNASYPLIATKFGSEMADSLKKSPVQIFDSLPLDTKRIIMRMANDPQPSPALTKS